MVALPGSQCGFLWKQCSGGVSSLSPSAVIPEGACCRDEEHRGENSLFSDLNKLSFSGFVGEGEGGCY